MSPNEGGNGSPVDVIAIASMGGMGKTTLARLVYEDKRITEEFQHKACVCISEEFDPVQATKAILKSLDGKIELEQSDDLDPHQRQLKDTLKDKKFFLVLDDKSCGPEIFIAWSHYKMNIVGSYLQTMHLAANVLIQNLNQLVETIVSKCGGLPLAIKTLGSLLGTKPTPQYWGEILKSDIWSLSEDESKIIPSLRLSYHYLPSNLKRCFTFCSIFPKDYLIEKDVLIQLWMAEGLLHSAQTSKNFEEVGNKSSMTYNPAKSVMGEFCVQLEVGRVQEISAKARYFSFRRRATENLETFKNFKCHQLRSFILLDGYVFFDENDRLSRLSHLNYIRELSLAGCTNFQELVDDIGNLKHLHYLDLSETSIEKLPNSMCLLINLQTLRLRDCHCLVEFSIKFSQAHQLASS
ncbi:putative disease resistance protein RGA3 [Prosopis cineraria]|uniref:putative disease resistance protein RGA3 n=1 Tax=Prosopis cineraria TaxID=364024 RepID=UPI00240F3C65|nr:putative disease resistance protein RGA3 [Prosopis cineraria]